MADVATLPRLLKELRLPTMAHQWEGLAARAQEGGWTLGEYLAALCEAELLERERRRLARHLQESHLPPAKTLHHLDFDANPTLPRQQVVALAAEGGWVERAENLLLFGPSGVGKTHIAAAIGHGLVAQGVRVRFTSATTLVQALQVAKQALQLADALAKLDKYRLLILDDLGYVQRSEMETVVLFELIAHRYESGSLLITSHHPFSDWDRIFPDTMRERRRHRPPRPPRPDPLDRRRELPQGPVAGPTDNAARGPRTPTGQSSGRGPDKVIDVQQLG
jgi:DNA replication protein DnaC